MVNGGLGFMFSGPVGSDNIPKWGVVVYSVVTGLVGILYTAFVIWQTKKMGGEDPAEMKERFSYDSERSINERHSDFTGCYSNSLRGQGFTNGHNTSSNIAPIYDRVT
jgi:hypothetical protein